MLSSQLPTHDLALAADVAAQPDGIEVTATLASPVLGDVELVGGDRLWAYAAGRAAELTGGPGSYSAHLGVMPTPGTVVRLELDRADGATATSTVVLPPPVRFISPAPGTTFDRQRELRVSMADPGRYLLHIADSCRPPPVAGETTSQGISTVGRDLVLPPGATSTPLAERAAPTCTVSLDVERRVFGTTARALGGSTITATSAGRLDLQTPGRRP